MIYLARGVEDYYKIGYTTSEETLETRMRTLQTGCPMKIKVIKSCYGTLNDEKKLHRWFQDKRKEGEWFEFNDFLVKKVCRAMDEIEEEKDIKENKQITITEYDYRFKDSILQYRFTKNCYKIMKI